VSGPWRRLERASWIAWLTHAAAGLAMLLVLRNGLETNSDVQARLRFVAEHRTAWILAWLTWNVAALSILYFSVAFAAAHAQGRAWAPFALALALCSAAVACDLGAESILMGLLPGLTTDAGAFIVWQRAAVVLTGYVANGLYTGATCVLWWSTRDAYSRPALLAGLLLCLAGGALSVAALLGSVAGLFWTNAVLLPALLAWLALVARDAGARASL
jgi:hypothetical protein